MRAVIATLALVLVIIGSITRVLAGEHPVVAGAAGWLAITGMAAYLLLEGWRVRGTARFILGGSVVAAAAGLLFLADPWTVLTKGARDGAAVIALFAALGFLREAADGSPMIRACGTIMVRQPPGRRYMVLAWGSHVISLVLNFGTLALLGTMIRQGNTAEAAGGNTRIVAIRTQRMMNAMLRGFATVTIWSPLSISFVVTQNAVHGLSALTLVPVQMVLALLIQTLGWHLDRQSFPPPKSTPTPTPAPTPTLSNGQWRPLFHLCLLVGGVMGASAMVAWGLETRLVMGAMMVVPPTALAWLILRHRSPMAAGVDLAKRLTVTMPGSRAEVVMLGCAMFLGTVLSAFFPAQTVARLLDGLPIHPALLVAVIAWAVMALAQIGLSQIVTVTVLGGALSSLSHPGIPPLVLASGLMAAWALSICSTPVGAATMIIARLSDVDLRTVARNWNGRFVLLGGVLITFWLVLLVEILDLFQSLA